VVFDVENLLLGDPQRRNAIGVLAVKGIRELY